MRNTRKYLHAYTSKCLVSTRNIVLLTFVNSVALSQGLLHIFSRHMLSSRCGHPPLVLLCQAFRVLPARGQAELFEDACCSSCIASIDFMTASLTAASTVNSEACRSFGASAQIMACKLSLLFCVLPRWHRSSSFLSDKRS